MNHSRSVFFYFFLSFYPWKKPSFSFCSENRQLIWKVKFYRWRSIIDIITIRGQEEPRLPRCPSNKFSLGPMPLGAPFLGGICCKWLAKKNKRKWTWCITWDWVGHGMSILLIAFSTYDTGKDWTPTCLLMAIRGHSRGCKMGSMLMFTRIMYYLCKARAVLLVIFMYNYQGHLCLCHNI